MRCRRCRGCGDDGCSSSSDGDDGCIDVGDDSGVADQSSRCCGHGGRVHVGGSFGDYEDFGSDLIIVVRVASRRG